MGIGVIPIPILIESHSHSHCLFNSCPIPMGFPFPLGFQFPCTSLLQRQTSVQTKTVFHKAKYRAQNRSSRHNLVPASLSDKCAAASDNTSPAKSLCFLLTGLLFWSYSTPAKSHKPEP